MKFAATLTVILAVTGACLVCHLQASPPAPAAAPAAAPATLPVVPPITATKLSPQAALMGKMAIDKKPADKDAITKGLADADPQVRRFAIYGLERLADPASAKDLIPLLKDGDAFARREAAIALGKLGNKEAIAPLTAALNADDLHLRVEAFQALGRIADPATQGDILKAMQDDRLWKELDSWDLHRVIQTFTRDFFTDRGAIPVLKKVLAFKDLLNVNLPADDANKQKAALPLANRAAEILAVKFGDASGEDALVEGVNSADDYMQQSSADAVGLLKSRKAVPGLVKLLANEWIVNRRKAVLALGAIGDAAAVPELEKLLADKDARLRVLAAAALEKIDGKKRLVDANDPPAVVLKEGDAAAPQTPGGKRPPQFICLGVDDCVNAEGLEAMLDICETLKDKGAKAVFTMWVAPLASDYQNRDIEKQKLLFQRLFDLGCEIANHTLMHNPGGIYWTARPPAFQEAMIQGAADWYRNNITGFTRPFTIKGGGGAQPGANPDPNFTQTMIARQRFLYGGGRSGNHPNKQAWPAAPQPGVQPYFRLDTGCLDAAAPPVHATITDTILSDYSGRFDYEVPQGLAMWKSNFEYHYALPHRPILAVNAFHDWGLKRPDGEGTKGSHRNESAILKAFLLDVLVTNKDKFPDAHCVTFRQVVEYAATGGDLKHTLDAGNCQDNRNPVMPKVD